MVEAEAERGTVSVRELEPEVIAWVEQSSFSRIERHERLVGGNRREAWTIDGVASDGAVKRMFMLYDRVARPSDINFLSIRREASIYRYLAGRGLPVPALIDVHPSLDIMLVERIDGSHDLRRVETERESEAIATDLVRNLARLHDIPVSSGLLAAIGARDEGSTKDAVRKHIDLWEQLYREVGTEDVLIATGLKWLKGNLPDSEDPPTIVHGDFGPGNFLFRNSRVAGIVDWELWHLGDWHEDLAWLSFRWTLYPFPGFATRLREYERFSGRNVDVQRFRYCRVFVHTQALIMRHRSAGNPSPNGDVANGLMSTALNRRFFFDSLCDASGLQPGPTGVMPVSHRLEQDWVFDAALRMMRDVVVPNCRPSVAGTAAKSVVRLIKYLKAAYRIESALENRERQCLQDLLHQQPDSLLEGRRRLVGLIKDGSVSLLQSLQYIRVIVENTTELTAESLGALAHRELPSPDDRIDDVVIEVRS
jgi:aminoglycoside phosphotransferase (APT) family kinase protein